MSKKPKIEESVAPDTVEHVIVSEISPEAIETPVVESVTLKFGTDKKSGVNIEEN